MRGALVQLHSVVGIQHLLEMVSTDEMLCPRVLDELNHDDWTYNIHADYKTYFFSDFEYLKRRIAMILRGIICYRLWNVPQVASETLAIVG